MMLLENCGLIFCLSLLLICTNSVGVKAASKIVFKEDFENGSKFSHWATNGDFEVNFAGSTSEISYSGKHSFKIDITWKSGAYNYWWNIPINIPFYGRPRLKGKIYVKEGNAKLGFAWADPQVGTSENVIIGDKESKTQKEGWMEFTVEATSSSSNDLSYVMNVAVFMFLPKDKNRTIVYIDDLEVSADLSSDWEYMFKAKLEEINRQKESENKHIKQTIEYDIERLSKISDSFKEIKKLPQASSWIQEHRDKLYNYVTETLPKIESQFKVLNQSFSINELMNARHSLKLLENAVTSLEFINQFVKQNYDLPYLIYIVSEPISNNKVTPTGFPVPGIIGTEFKLSACVDEYEPVSFVIYSQQELKNVLVKAGSLNMEKYTISEKEIDIRTVKCWWQAGDSVNDVTHTVLTPELLLKNSDLVIVDNEKKRNTLANPKAPQDAKDLQPVTIPAKTNQQFWITVHIPDGTKPGTYKGNIKVSIDNASAITLPISIEVLPFRLEESILEYAIFYRGLLSSEEWVNKELRFDEPGKPEIIISDRKSEKQYIAELVDMKEHGITLPSIYDGVGELPDGKLDFSHLKKVLDARKKSGLTKSPVLQMGHGLNIAGYVYEKDIQKKKKILKQIKERISEWVKFVKETGYPEPLFYGIDEAYGELLDAQKEAYKAIKESGGKCGVALMSGFFERVGEFLDRPVVAIGLSKHELEEVHKMGYKVWIYTNPQVGEENPETYRRNYGLYLWKNGYDGACNYAYQHGFNNPWDDFDNTAFRDHMFTYPTIDGVIPTIQWEGWREGYNDIRYLSTLLKYIEKAKIKEKNRSLANEIENKLKEIDIYGDLYKVRKQLIEWIIQLL